METKRLSIEKSLPHYFCFNATTIKYIDLRVGRSIQTINNLKKDISTGLHRLVIGTFNVDSGLTILNQEVRCLRRWRRWRRAMSMGTHGAFWASRWWSCMVFWAPRWCACTVFRTGWSTWRRWRHDGISHRRCASRRWWSWWLLGECGARQCSKCYGGEYVSFHRIYPSMTWNSHHIT
jgi:hypothetical protein